MIIDISYQGFLSPKCPKAHFRGKNVTPGRILDDFLLFDRKISVQSKIPKMTIVVTAKEWGGEALICFLSTTFIVQS